MFSNKFLIINSSQWPATPGEPAFNGDLYPASTRVGRSLSRCPRLRCKNQKKTPGLTGQAGDNFFVNMPIVYSGQKPSGCGPGGRSRDRNSPPGAAAALNFTRATVHPGRPPAARRSGKVPRATLFKAGGSILYAALRPVFTRPCASSTARAVYSAEPSRWPCGATRFRKIYSGGTCNGSFCSGQIRSAPAPVPARAGSLPW